MNRLIDVDKGMTDDVLADFYDAGLHDLDVDGDGALHATAEDPYNERQFKITVSGSANKPSVSCTEVNSHPLSEDPFNLRRYEPPVGPVELLADPDLDNWHWRQVISAVLDLHEIAAFEIERAAMTAARDEAERLTGKWAEAPTLSPLADVEEAFEVFKGACRRRAPYCQEITLSWRPSFEGLPVVTFGLAPGGPEQILYKANPNRSRQLYLNGFSTAEDGLERDLLDHYPDDAWARLGAMNAARDLLEIQRTAADLMSARRAQTTGILAVERSVHRLRTLLEGPGPMDEPWAWSTFEEDRIQQDCVMLFHRISDYVGSLHVVGRPTGLAFDEVAH